MSLNPDAIPFEQDISLRGNEIQDVRLEERHLDSSKTGYLTNAESWQGRILLVKQTEGDRTPAGAPPYCIMYIGKDKKEEYIWHYTLDQVKKAIKNVDLNSNKITNLAPGVNPEDAVNVSQLNQAELGLNPLDPVIAIIDKPADMPVSPGLYHRYMIGGEASSWTGTDYEDHVNHIIKWNGASWDILTDIENSMLFVYGYIPYSSPIEEVETLHAGTLIAYNPKLLEDFKWVPIYVSFEMLEGEAIEIDNRTINFKYEEDSIEVNEDNEAEVKLKEGGGIGRDTDGHFIDVDNETVIVENNKVKIIKSLYEAGQGLYETAASGKTTFHVGGDSNQSIKINKDGIEASLNPNGAIIKTESGMAVNVDGTTITITGNTMSVSGGYNKKAVFTFAYTGNGSQVDEEFLHNLNSSNVVCSCYRIYNDGTLQQIYPNIKTNKAKVFISMKDKIDNNFDVRVVVEG